MCPRIPVGSNVFLVSYQCLSSVIACVILDNFTPFCYFGSAVGAISLIVITVGRRDDLFYSHCNGENYNSYFCFVIKVS